MNRVNFFTPLECLLDYLNDHCSFEEFNRGPPSLCHVDNELKYHTSCLVRSVKVETPYPETPLGWEESATSDSSSCYSFKVSHEGK